MFLEKLKDGYVKKTIIKMTSKTYDCNFCKRSYREKVNYDRHIVCCEFLYKTKKEQDHEIDLSIPIPSQTEMFQIIQHLSCRIQKLEKENKKLNQITRKKQNILELLNTPEYCSSIELTFSEWIKNHILTNVHDNLEIVYKNDLLHGLYSVFDNAISNFNFNKLPIQTFENSNAFYVFQNSENNNKQWVRYTSPQLDKYIRRITNQFAYDFQDYWYEPHKQLIETQEDYNDLYLNYYEKILGGKISESIRFQKLKKHIFNQIKQSPKSIIEFTV